MIVKILDAHHAGDYRVWLRFSDDLSGEINLEQELWGPVFLPLKHPAEFAKLQYNKDAGTIIWPNGADFAPEFLYDQLKAVLSQSHAAE